MGWVQSTGGSKRKGLFEVGVHLFLVEHLHSVSRLSSIGFCDTGFKFGGKKSIQDCVPDSRIEALSGDIAKMVGHGLKA